MIQWLRLRASSSGDPGSILGWETKIPPAMWHSQRKQSSTPVALNKVVLGRHFGKHPCKKEHTQIYLELQFLKGDGPAREKLEQASILGYMVTKG